MKIIKLSLACAASLMLAAPALAGNTFDGLYLGAHVGYADGDDKGKEFTAGEFEGWTQKTKLSGAPIGGFVGYNRVLENNVLIGVEGEYEYRGYSDRDTQKLNGVEDACCRVKTKLKDAASLRARLGYVFNESKTLVYATAGYAALKVKRDYDFEGGSSIHFGDSEWQDGWTAGLGAEHQVLDQVTARLEYRYSDFGRESVKTTSQGISVVEKQRYEDEQSIRVGVAYHF